MFNFFAHPVYFYGLILAILVVSLIAIFSMGEGDKKTSKKQEEDVLEARLRSSELEKAMGEKELEYKEAISALEKSLNDKAAAFTIRTAALEEQLRQQEALKSELARSKPVISQNTEALKQAALINDNLKKELIQLKEKLDKANKELLLSNEMYNGLKGQYDELEDKFSQFSEERLKEPKKDLPRGEVKAAPEAPKPRVTIPKIPNLRSTVQPESEDIKAPPAETK